MSDDTFLILISLLIIGACLFMLGKAALWYMNRSDLYSQERYDKAFWAIVRREKRLAKQRARLERQEETVDGFQQYFQA